jgi:hypothetical protein
VHGGCRFIVHTDGHEKSAFPLNQDRHAWFALAGNNGINFPMTSLRPQFDMAWAFGYVDAMRYLGTIGFLGRRPFMPFFMAPDQVLYEVPASRVNPQID